MSEEEPTQSRRDTKADVKAEKARAKAQRPWYKKKRYLGPLGLLLLIVIISVAAGGDDGDGEVASDPASEEGTDDASEEEEGTGDGEDEEPEQIGIGETAQDGRFTFTVNEPLDCGQKVIGEEPVTDEAQGQWCIMAITVENHGDRAQALSASNQYLYDEQDREFSAGMPMAAMGDTPIYEQINPGNTVEGRVFFDVPEDIQPVAVELHDSAFSGGVRVNLQG